MSGQVVESDHVLKSGRVVGVFGQASYFSRLAGSGFVYRSLHTPCLSLGTGHLESCEAAHIHNSGIRMLLARLPIGMDSLLVLEDCDGGCSLSTCWSGVD